MRRPASVSLRGLRSLSPVRHRLSPRARLTALSLLALPFGILAACSSDAETPGVDGGGAVGPATGSDGGVSDGQAPPIVCPPAPASAANDLLKPIHHDGQTFVTWKDAAEGDAGAQIRYNVYRSLAPITQDNLASAELVAPRVLNDSAKLFGTAFNAAARLDPSTGMTVIEQDAAPLPGFSGLSVQTAREEACAYYAVLPANLEAVPQDTVKPGINATTGPVTEHVTPRKPIKIMDSNDRGIYSSYTNITGTPGLPLYLTLHASDAAGGPAGAYGDYWVYYGDRSMGYADGLPGVYSVEETHSGPLNLLVRTRDTIVSAEGFPYETYWFGYRLVPDWAPNTQPLAYPFTEQRLLWMMAQIIPRYQADPNRIACGGGSMGAWGSTSFCFHHPEIFSVVYPDRPRTRQRDLPTIGKPGADVALMDDGKTPYLERMDSVKFAADHHEDLPFYAFVIGRNDGFAQWQDQVDMVRALTASHHGFAFIWNNGGHGDTGPIAERLQQMYPIVTFGKNRSYPAFSHSSRDNNLGNGDPLNGDLEGSINTGFTWNVVADEDARWQATIGNTEATATMTVDVTPRRAQKFRLAPGTTVSWTSSTGGAGTVQADAWSLVTLPTIAIQAGKQTTVTITR